LMGNFDTQRKQYLERQFSPDRNQEPDFGLDIPPGGQLTMTGLLTQPVEIMADARRRWLEFAASQNAKVVEGVKKALRLREGTPAASYFGWTEDAVNSYVAFQTRWLDLLTQLPSQVARGGNKKTGR